MGVRTKTEPVVFLLTGVMQLFNSSNNWFCQALLFFNPQVEILGAFLVNEEINCCLCSRKHSISGEEDTALGSKRHNSCSDASFKMGKKQINSIFFWICPGVNIGHTQTNIWKRQSIFFLYVFLLGFLLLVFTAAIPHFWATKGKKEGEENGGGRSTPALLLPCGWRIQSLLAFLQDTRPTNTYFKVKEKEEEVWGRKGGRPERKKKKTPDRQANRLTETECQEKREREKEKKVGDIDSKMSKW